MVLSMSADKQFLRRELSYFSRGAHHFNRGTDYINRGSDFYFSTSVEHEHCHHPGGNFHQYGVKWRTHVQSLFHPLRRGRLLRLA